MKLLRNMIISAKLLMAHPLRTILSVSAIVLAVAALTSIVSIGNGMQLELEEVFRAQGTNLLMVRAGQFKQRGNRSRQMTLATTLTPSDAVAIRKQVSSAVSAAGAIMRDMKVRSAVLSAQTFVEAMESEAFAIRNIEAENGRLFTPAEEKAGRLVAVLGPKTATNLYGESDPVGERVTIGKSQFTVVGVLTERGSDASGRDQDDIIYVPLDPGMKRLFKVVHVETIYVQGRSENDLEEATNEIRALLRHKHRLGPKKEDDFTIMNQLTLLETAIETTSAATRLVLGVAMISMLVAGIGILAVMLMAVRERRWEIGLRRAIGARRGDILSQFLGESALLSLAGGLTGVFLAIVVVGACNRFGWARADFSAAAAVASCTFSIVIGVVFGIYPAKKAANLQPIEALNS